MAGSNGLSAPVERRRDRAGATSRGGAEALWGLWEEVGPWMVRRRRSDVDGELRGPVLVLAVGHLDLVGTSEDLLG